MSSSENAAFDSSNQPGQYDIFGNPNQTFLTNFTTTTLDISHGDAGFKPADWRLRVTGIANDLTMWDAQVAALGKDYRTLRYDLRGHGDTLATEEFTM